MADFSLNINDINFKVRMNDTDTAKKVKELLPIEEKGRFWGDEIYFPVSLQKDNESPTENLEVGDLAFWPEGPALALFFGQTPASTNGEPKPASPVTVIGKVQDEEKLNKLKSLDSAQVALKKS